MTLTINDTTMTSDHTAHTVRQVPSGHGCEMSWLADELLDRNAAIAAMTLTDTAAERDRHEGHPLCPYIQGGAVLFGLTGHDVVARATLPPGDIRSRQKQDGERSGPFAAMDRR